MLDCLINFYNAVNDARIRKNDPPQVILPRKFDATERKLARMLQEKIPTNICDSGCVSGYMYQRNRKSPIWDKPETWFEFSVCQGKLDILPYTNIFHFLNGMLTYDKKWDSQFQKWRMSLDCPDEYSHHLEEFRHPGDGCTYKWIGDYTYNFTCSLSQDYTFYTTCGENGYICDDDLIVLEMHNGADARWGFTNPALFRVSGSNDWTPVPYGTHIYCSECSATWDMEEQSSLTEPYDYENSSNPSFNPLEEYPVEKGTEGKKGVVVVTEDYHAFCPVCGNGILE